MAISTIKRHYKTLLFILLLAFFGNIFINTGLTTAITYPKIFKQELNWPIATGFFHGQSAYKGGAVIANGFRRAYSYEFIKKATGGGDIVSDKNGTRLSAEVGGLLNGLKGNADAIGAAYIIFTMLEIPASSAGSDPVAVAKEYYAEWAKMVDDAFDQNRVVRMNYGSDGSGITNTMSNRKSPADVVWYKDTKMNKNFNSLLFLESENSNINDALYAIRIDCGNPMGGYGGPIGCTCTTGQEECCEDPTPPPTEYCPLKDSAYSIRYGGTQAQSGVVNLTSGTGWKYTDGATNKEQFVWAKPGDTVRFQHTLCYGAQNVRGSRDNGRSTTQPSNDVKPTISNRATITASSKPSGGGKYLFGSSLNGGATQSFTVPVGAEKPSSSKPDNAGKYWFRYYSPGNNADSAYSCYAADRGFPQFTSNGYQIPDFLSTTIPANCNSAKKASSASDAGRVIEQKLSWNNVKAWQNTHNTGSGGKCNCNNQNAYATNTTHSYEDMKAGRHTPGTRTRKCFQAASTGCGWCSSYPSYGTRDYYHYPIKTTQENGADQVVQVKIPFNYNTKPNVNTSQDILFSGGEYAVNVTAHIEKRLNTEVSGSSYSTISKSTNYEIVAFTVAPDKSFTQIAHGNDRKPGQGSDQACSYYGTGATACRTLLRTDGTRFNNKGSLLGSTEQLFSGDIAVPDAEAGTKFCVAVGVWPSDSHDFTGGAAGKGDTALKINKGTYWNYSEPACRTITKKPTVQFHSAGVYSAGGITTTQTKKSVGYVFGSNGSGSKLQSGALNSGKRSVFGSFSEYETIARGNIKGFASGAGFGYGMNNGGNLTGSKALPGGYPNVPYTTEANACTYSTQTFSNDKCRSKVTGASSINSLGSTILNRLTARYTEPSIKGMRTPTIDFSKYETLENGTKYIKVNGDAAISASYCMNKGSVKNNNTFVIDVTGTLTIAGNIKYGVGGGANCNSQTYSNIAELPQILIFADDINIRSNVTHIDAWLISGQRGQGNGNINTCSDLSFSQIGNGHTIPKKTTSLPCASQLKVNGPVFAKKLILNRNAGAGTGNASIQAAEVFNLRPDTYLWAYNQASRFSQAVTTYQRELAPRY